MVRPTSYIPIPDLYDLFEMPYIPQTPIVAQPPETKEQVWFQSDQYLTNITEAVEFQVTKRWFRDSWKLEALLNIWETNWRGELYIDTQEWKCIGIYSSKETAALSLDQARKALNLKVINYYD